MNPTSFPSRRHHIMLLLCLILGATWSTTLPVRAADRKSGELTPDEITRQQTKQTYLLILGDTPDFATARCQAAAVARRSGVAFSMMGRIYDAKRGLILPDNDPDPVYAGGYLLRRGNGPMELPETGKPATEFITIERSEAYDGLRKNLYIVVGGLYLSRAEAQRELARFTPFVPGAYLRRTPIYYGCLH